MPVRREHREMVSISKMSLVPARITSQNTEQPRSQVFSEVGRNQRLGKTKGCVGMSDQKLKPITESLPSAVVSLQDGPND